MAVNHRGADAHAGLPGVGRPLEGFGSRRPTPAYPSFTRGRATRDRRAGRLGRRLNATRWTSRASGERCSKPRRRQPDIRPLIEGRRTHDAESRRVRPTGLGRVADVGWSSREGPDSAAVAPATKCAPEVYEVGLDRLGFSRGERPLWRSSSRTCDTSCALGRARPDDVGFHRLPCRGRFRFRTRGDAEVSLGGKTTELAVWRACASSRRSGSATGVGEPTSPFLGETTGSRGRRERERLAATVILWSGAEVQGGVPVVIRLARSDLGEPQGRPRRNTRQRRRGGAQPIRPYESDESSEHRRTT